MFEAEVVSKLLSSQELWVVWLALWNKRVWMCVFVYHTQEQGGLVIAAAARVSHLSARRSLASNERPAVRRARSK